MLVRGSEGARLGVASCSGGDGRPGGVEAVMRRRDTGGHVVMVVVVVTAPHGGQTLWRV